MSQPEQPQIYLVTPPEIELSRFTGQLAAALDAHPVACVRLALSTREEDDIARAADACREITHARDIALVLESHIALVERLGLDGVHLVDGARSVRKARKALGPDAIVGAHCGDSRHDGLNAGESGADYVSFGPVGQTALGDGAQAGAELFAWWSEMIELPVVAEGALDADTIAALAPVTDFFGIGAEIWREDDPAQALLRLVAAMG
ncbi:thiamine phosphate synthase [Roseovarius spongiae]|uniref:Thiamine phosphate synthase n=1 Tax=Roseovarius spongiae TaxID=2320272 RepID=A0A3A8AX63_9RHOB|nr:thiamine phosphate synthase [Roseovarius spongiae]RKF17028.1 thiamine phosphate synthase [Roseovarius spongiae]